MKHAYLILAHNQFAVLSCLIQALDDERNDIYVHFDSKLEHPPILQVNKSTLYIVENRVDVRWGDVSVIEAEYALFRRAVQQQVSYSYYHLLSGVDMPLRSPDDVHAFFDTHQGKEFVGYSQYDYASEVDRKVNRYHLFAKDFRYGGGILSMFKKIGRALYLRIQLLFGWKRNPQVEFKKGTQWVSITEAFVHYLLNRKDEVLATYRNTFCSDEIFIQTLCWHSSFRSQLFDQSDEARGCMRKIGWKDGKLYDWQESDYEEIMQSGFIFARKFNKKEIGLVKRILTKVSDGE